MDDHYHVLYKLMLKVNISYHQRLMNIFFFLVPITFFGEPIQYAELNSAVLIKCRVLANPSAEVSWFKGRDKTRLISPNYERSNDGLKIHQVSLADNDIFWC